MMISGKEKDQVYLFAVEDSFFPHHLRSPHEISKTLISQGKSEVNSNRSLRFGGDDVSGLPNVGGSGIMPAFGNG